VKYIVTNPTLAMELSTAVLIGVGALSVVILVVIIIAPWKEVRDEPPLDPSVETKLLLNRNPDEPTGEVPRVRNLPLDDDADDEPGIDLTDLADLDEPESRS
jgi:hypothetical protein